MTGPVDVHVPEHPAEHHTGNKHITLAALSTSEDNRVTGMEVWKPNGRE